jgi:hypothetical protein
MLDAPAPRRVVLAEDDPALLGLLDRALGAAGFEVLTAPGGWELHRRLAEPWTARRGKGHASPYGFRSARALIVDDDRRWAA